MGRSPRLMTLTKAHWSAAGKVWLAKVALPSPSAQHASSTQMEPAGQSTVSRQVGRVCSASRVLAMRPSSALREELRIQK